MWLSHHRLVRGSLSFLTVLCFTLSVVLPAMMQSAIAQGVKADQNASTGNQATITNNQNGPTQVDIVTPNGTGVSHNIYETYNVGQQGLILNNSATGGNSQLGGQINGNANLTAGNEASIILNEVTGASRSQLLGTTEVFGKSADVILANPYGVTCNGCGFINTPRATLSTGRPVFNGENFIGLDVKSTDADGGLYLDENGKRADVRIEGAGADVSGLHYFDLIARAIYIGAEIKGNASSNGGKGTKIGLYAGLNRFHYDGRTLTKLEDGDGTGGGIEIDSVLLGGAYANQITLLSTEKGVGINAPDVQSALGGIQLSADGKITIGKARAKKKIKVASQNSGIDIKDYVFSETALELAATGKISLGANARAGSLGDVSIEGILPDGGTVKTGSLDLAGGALLGAGMDENGDLVGNGKLTIEAASLMNRGTITSQNDLTITVSGTTDNYGSILSQSALALLGGGVFENRSGATFSGVSTVSLDINSGTNVGLVSSTGASVVFSVFEDLNNVGTISADATASFDVAGTFDNSGDVTAKSGVSIANAQVNNSGSITSQGNVSLNTVAGLVNSGTLVSEAGDLSVTSTGDVTNSGDISGVKSVSLDVAGNVVNDIEGTLTTDGTLLVKAQTLDNLGDFPNGITGGVLSGRDVDLQIGTLNNFGEVLADNDIRIDAESSVFNIFGRIEAGNRVDITAVERIENLSGIIRGKKVTLKADVVTNVDVVERDGEVLLPETLLADLEKSSEVLVKKALEAYQLQRKDLDVQEIDALRDRLINTAKDILKKTPGADIGNRQAILDRVSAGLVQDIASHAEAAQHKQKQGAGFFSRSGLEKEVKDAADQLRVSQVDAVSKKITGFFGLASGSSGNFEDTIVRKAEISASDNLTIQAGSDVTAIGGKLSAGNNLDIRSGGTITITAQQLESRNNRRIKGGHENEYTLVNEQAELIAGGNIKLTATDDIALSGAKVKADRNVSVRSTDGEIRLSSVVNKRDYDYKKKKSGLLGFNKKKTVKKAYDEKNILTSITSGGEVLITSDTQDVLVRGTEIEAQKNIHLRSGKKNVLLEAVADIHDYENYTSKSSFWGLSSKSKRDKGNSITHQPTFVSAAGDVILDSAAGDLIINGSVVEAGQDIRVYAQNVQINAVHDYHYQQITEKQRGFFFDSFSGDGSAGVTFGYKNEKHVNTDTARLAKVSGLFADGSIVMDVENDFTSEAAQLIAKNNLIINAGGDITVLAAYDDITHSEKHKSFQIGITASVQENVSSAIETLKDVPDNWNAGAGSETNRVITRASTALKTIDTVSGLITGPLVSAGLSLGVSSSKSKANADQHNAVGGVMEAGNDIILASAADITLTGTQATAGRNIITDAANDLTIQSALSTYSETSSSRQAGASVGVTVGLGLQGVTVGGNVGVNFNKANSDASGTTHNHALIQAGNRVTLKSGKDTIVRGAQVAAREIEADVGGDLTVESVQDTYRLRSKNAGFGLSLSMGLYSAGWSDAKGPNGQVVNKAANFSDAWNTSTGTVGELYNGTGEHSKTAGISFSFGKGKADVAWTNVVTKLHAFDSLTINTKGNTHLKGAALLAENSTPVINTGTFTFEDIQDYNKSTNFNISASYSFSFGGPELTEKQQQAQEKARLAKLGPIGRTVDGLPPFKVEGLYEKSVTEAVTRATVSKGTRLTVQDEQKQAELEESGKTKKFAAINTDVDDIQEVTKDEREFVGFYASDTSVKAVAEVADKAIQYIDALVKEGKISSERAKTIKEVKKKFLDGEVAIFCAGQKQGWLHRLLFTPAYAAGEGCVVKYLGAEALYNQKDIRLTDEEVNALNKEIAAKLYKQADHYKTQIEYLTKLLDVAKTDDRKQLLEASIKKHNADLDAVFENIVLCTTNNEFALFLDKRPFFEAARYQPLLNKAKLNKLSADGYALNTLGASHRHKSDMIKTAEANLDARMVKGYLWGESRKNAELYNLLIVKGNKTPAQQELASSIFKSYGVRHVDMDDAMRKQFLSDASKSLSKVAFGADLEYAWIADRLVENNGVTDVLWSSHSRMKRDKDRATVLQVFGHITNDLELTKTDQRAFKNNVNNDMWDHWVDNRSIVAYAKGVGKYASGAYKSGVVIIGADVTEADSRFVPVINSKTGKPLEVIDKSLIQKGLLYFGFDAGLDESKRNYLYVDLVTGQTVEVSREDNKVIATFGDYFNVVDAISNATGVYALAKVGGKAVVANAIGKGGAKVGAPGIAGAVDEGLELAAKRTGNVARKVGDCSFHANTPVLMANGTFKKIIDIRIGDLVASRNEFTKRYSVRPVTHLLSRLHTDRVKLTVTSGAKSEVITTTPEHPFYVEGKGFIRADILKPGMQLSQWQPKASPVHTVGFRESDASGALLVKAVTVEGAGVPEWRAYNLTVGRDHTYYVGRHKVWVHNAGPGDCLPDSAQLVGKTANDEAIYKVVTQDGKTQHYIRGLDNKVHKFNPDKEFVNNSIINIYDYPVTNRTRTSFGKTVTKDDIVEAPSWKNPDTGKVSRAGHYADHNISKDQVVDVVNNPDRIFTGTYHSGRSVDIYLKGDTVIITEAGKKKSVITGYPDVDASRWLDKGRWKTNGYNTERYIEIYR